MNLNDPVEIDLLYHQSVTDVFEQKIPLTKSDAVSLLLFFPFGFDVVNNTVKIQHRYFSIRVSVWSRVPA